MTKYLFNKIGVIIIIFIVLLSGIVCSFLFNDKSTNEVSYIEKESSTTVNKRQYVDVKGSVVRPGVYEFSENDRVIDAINYAGGLKKDANTNNINLSKKLTSEMVIYVYKDKDIKSNNLTCSAICNTEVIEVNNCIEKDNKELININTSTSTELQTLTGIGESKALSIISYREEHGNFKSIDDIKNVSGIGDALFEQIKDKITI